MNFQSFHKLKKKNFKKSFKKLKIFSLTKTILPKILMFTLIVLIIYHNFLF